MTISGNFKIFGYAVILLTVIALSGFINKQQNFYSNADKTQNVQSVGPETKNNATSNSAEPPIRRKQTKSLPENIAPEPPNEYFTAPENNNNNELAGNNSSISTVLENAAKAAGKILPENISNKLKKAANGNKKDKNNSMKEDPLTVISIDCPYNKEAGQQCGGGLEPGKDVLGSCRRSVALAFYTNCNYGNIPQERPVPGYEKCKAISTATGCCQIINTPGCGPVKRLTYICINPITGMPECCGARPVSAEQCCGGSAWLWDSESKWVGCAKPSIP